MDFENIITPFVIRNNNEENQKSEVDVIQISSESDGEEGEQKLSQSLKNNNSLVTIGFARKCIDIRDCYEFIGLQTPDDNPKRSEEVPELDDWHQLEKRTEVSPEVPEPCTGIKQGQYFESPSKNCLKINLKRRIKHHESRTRRRDQYKIFKRHKERLRKTLFLGELHPKIDILTLIRLALDHISEIQNAMEENIVLFSKEERKNFLLREQLQRLTAENSCWPYNVEVSSDKISIKKMDNKFTF